MLVLVYTEMIFDMKTSLSRLSLTLWTSRQNSKGTKFDLHFQVPPFASDLLLNPASHVYKQSAKCVSL